MRTLLAVAAVALLVAPGCGDDNNNATPDLAMTAAADMSAPAGDMAKLNCGQILQCAASCAQSTNPASCVGACITSGSSTAQTKWNTMVLCGFGACGPQDGGTMMCTGPNDLGGTCQQCLNGVITSGLQGGGACKAEVQACASDT